MDDSKCNCNSKVNQVCDICQGVTGDEKDVEDYSNVLPFERTQTLDSLIEDAVGKAYLFGFLDENGDLQYTVGDDLEPEKLLLLLESIKMTYIYGL